jgi:uncharacterized protein YjdB
MTMVGNYDPTTWDYDAVYTRLSSSLLPGQNYTISFMAQLGDGSDKTTEDTHFQFAVGNTFPLSIFGCPGSCPGTLPADLVTLYEFTIHQPDHAWHLYKINIPYPLSYSTSTLVLWPAPYNDVPSRLLTPDWGEVIAIDDIRIEPTAAISTFELPAAVYMDCSLLDLTSFVSIPGGTFRWQADDGSGIYTSISSMFNPLSAHTAAIGATGSNYVTVSYDYVDALGCARTVNAETHILPSMVAYTVTGGGSYCIGGTGVHIGLSGSDAGINYQLYNGLVAVGTPTIGTGLALDFGLQTWAGIYTINAIGCTMAMTGTATISIMAPTAYTIGGGGSFCPGGIGIDIWLGGSSVGTNYQLYNGPAMMGPAIPGGIFVNFGFQTAAGIYKVIATDVASGCSTLMDGLAIVEISPVPIAYTVTGGIADYCTGGTGVLVGLSSTDMWLQYELYVGGTLVSGPITGTGSAISFGLQTVAGTYTVLATDVSTTCSSDMTGSSTISIVPLPTLYTVTGGGSYCAGSAGVDIALTGSEAGITYQLYNGSLAVGAALTGTGSALDFGLQTAAGTYTILATNTTAGCSVSMSGSAVVSILSIISYSVTGGGGYCPGGIGLHIGLSNSVVGNNYQLYMGGSTIGVPQAGTGTGFDFGVFTAPGTYTVLATNPLTSCSATMTGSKIITVGTLPTAYSVTGGTGGYCIGGTGVVVGLSSSNVGVNYKLFRGGTVVGSIVAGTGATINFGTQITAGTYTVLATNATTLCTTNMTGSAIIVVNPLPTLFTVTGGGSFCPAGTGVHVGLSSSTSAISYQLYTGGVAVGAPQTGTGSVIDFGFQTTVGTYTIVATNPTTGCLATMTGSASVAIYALPGTFSVTGGGSYSTGGTGVHIGLGGTATGVTYKLYLGGTPMSSALAGTGSALDFGLQLAVGTYTVLATNATTGCVNTMTGTAAIAINPLPALYTVTGGGAYCSGGTGVHVGLSGSTTAINYVLYKGTTIVGSTVAGTGSTLDFGLQTAVGTYTVSATSTVTTCATGMTGSVAVSLLPGTITSFSVTGGGIYCSGGAGVHFGLSGSSTGVSYQLYLGSGASGSPMTGTGSSLDFGFRTIAGTYTVLATLSSTGCTAPMSGSGTIVIASTPSLFFVTGGANWICAGDPGYDVGLSGSSIGVNYQLYNGTFIWGSPLAGTGSALHYGIQTSPGGYTVIASNPSSGCSLSMPGSFTITVYPLPTIYSMTGGGSYCAGTGGVHVGLSGTNTGITYQLFRDAILVGSPVAGTGSALDFGLIWAQGIYTVLAKDVTTTCTATMAGTAPVLILSPGPITPTTPGLCVGSTLALTGGMPGGTWTSSNTARATVSTTGVVTGVSAGSVSITYSGCATFTVKTLTVIATVAITGPTSVCSGSTITLSNTTTGGTWSSSNTALATVGATTGIVTGVATGVLTITYTFLTGCSTTCTVTVNTAPGPITASPTVCIGNTIPYTDGVSGGTWTSSNTAIATIGVATGIAVGVAAGTVNITYATMCAPSVTKLLTVNPAVPITGLTTVCTAHTITLSNASTGGTWSSGTPSIATVSSVGVVTGVASGTVVISYISPACGISTRTISVTVCSPKAGQTNHGTETLDMSGHVATEILVYPNPAQDNIVISYQYKASGQLAISISDVSGRVRYAATVDYSESSDVQKVVDISRLTPGVYFIDLTLNDQHVVKKIVKVNK